MEIEPDIVEFNWREQNKYHYSALDYLDKDINNLNVFKNHILCIYTVNNENSIPFLQFLFFRNMITGNCDFLNYIDLEGLIESQRRYNEFDSGIIERIKKYIISFIFNGTTSLINSKDVLFDGFLEEKGDNYLFFNIKNLEQCFYCSFNNQKNDLTLGLIDEIVNYTKIDDININPFIQDLFERNNEWKYLKNENDENYELPIVGYVSKNKKWLDFTLMFGETVDPLGKMGNCYYFTNYENAQKENFERKKNKGQCGMIKFALFPGIMKTYINLNLRKGNALEEETCSWMDVYDSCYYLERESDPFWVMKNYYQQVPLSIL
jgi:hypothetical protein